ncbi:hypothetical protein VTK73DRAFT_4361 [Phialemonium thermophilum]|uniref:Uncharacterized protein n=1 Tax=Phialemonium thermophilum TaxID=223376 RepID=A0ABR3Y038_9PEZI
MLRTGQGWHGGRHVPKGKGQSIMEYGKVPRYCICFHASCFKRYVPFLTFLAPCQRSPQRPVWNIYVDFDD